MCDNRLKQGFYFLFICINIKTNRKAKPSVRVVREGTGLQGFHLRWFSITSISGIDSKPAERNIVKAMMRQFALYISA